MNLLVTAFNALQSDIQAGRIGKVVVLDTARIGRDALDGMHCEEWAHPLPPLSKE